MNTPSVILRDISIPVELATTKAEIDKGLSGRPSLDSNKGMLFMFDHSAIFQFWMPDMHFPLDITRNALPLPKKSKPVWHRPSAPAQHVLEVNAHFAEHYGIQVGDAVQFVAI
jgi:uncharacterized membrane protein (UPF0127 family)